MVRMLTETWLGPSCEDASGNLAVSLLKDCSEEPRSDSSCSLSSGRRGINGERTSCSTLTAAPFFFKRPVT